MQAWLISSGMSPKEEPWSAFSVTRLQRNVRTRRLFACWRLQASPSAILWAGHCGSVVREAAHFVRHSGCWSRTLMVVWCLHGSLLRFRQRSVAAVPPRSACLATSISVMACGRSCIDPGWSGGVSEFLQTGASCLQAFRLARSASVAGHFDANCHHVLCYRGMENGEQTLPTNDLFVHLQYRSCLTWLWPWSGLYARASERELPPRRS